MKMIPTSIITAVIITVFGGPAHYHLYGDPPIPDGNLCTNNCTAWSSGPITNLLGAPVLRIASLRTTDATNSFGLLVSTNYGFAITSSNTVESVNISTGTADKPYTWLIFGTINTLTNRQYTTLVSDDVSSFNSFNNIDGFWNGTGTNERVFATPLPITFPYQQLFFKTLDVGPAQ